MDIRRRRSPRTVLASSLLIAGLTTVSLTATTALATGTASATTATLFSSTTPGSYAVTVPGDVTSATITAVGGTGHGSSPNDSGMPGEGGIVTVTATVSPGDSLTVTVGANGGANTGGSGAGSGGASDEGGGGGGGSAVFDGSTPLVVAGGGGGAFYYIGPGGNADQNGPGYPYAGGAGTLTGPGAGGTLGEQDEECLCGSPGSGMDGGDGGSGGGGGYFGGGGGAPASGEAFGGGGGSSYPSAATQWDTTRTPSVTITATNPIFSIATTSLPSATPGAPFGPVTLQANAGISTSPYSTTLKWKKLTGPRGLRLSSTGVLSGTPTRRVQAGPSSVEVQVTETVTTLNSQNRPVTTKATVQATIPLTIT
jgi:hypothetical protein